MGLFFIGGAVSNDVAAHSHSRRWHGSAWERMEAHLRAHAAGQTLHGTHLQLRVCWMEHWNAKCRMAFTLQTTGISMCTKYSASCTQTLWLCSCRCPSLTVGVRSCWFAESDALPKQYIIKLTQGSICFFHNFMFKYCIFVAMVQAM